MSLSTGTRLGTYEVTARLGEGGMGEVYQATDLKLGRDVAIKVLPAELAHDPERLARFEREAKLLASLNHPNIAHVYGFESATLADGSATRFLAMELVEGEDLAERLKRGAVPVDEARPEAAAGRPQLNDKKRQPMRRNGSSRSRGDRQRRSGPAQRSPFGPTVSPGVRATRRPVLTSS